MDKIIFDLPDTSALTGSGVSVQFLQNIAAMMRTDSTEAVAGAEIYRHFIM